ncbi:MAG: NADH-quinone oxidoreductase subunit NuoG [bacterium]|nr:NADH-quinone oxidoreductase subunit NuoG [bacterium]MCY3925630.1 NADH-quinone oxidoreductase subunit NuoG [bacterium]
MSETPVRITVDGGDIDAAPGQLLIDACEQAGAYIPRFCYHPRMRPVGMCRMCLVDVDTGRGPALAPSCMLEVSEGMVVETASDAARKAQDGVLEFLLVNHPLDCPVCDKGGECPLQDQTMAYGPGESRFVESKRHFDKPLPISDLVYLDRERCILCDRCTRFADEVAGEPLIGFQGRGYHTEVNTFPDRPFDSYFSGNTVQICPVGALTARPYRFRARPWDLTETTSTYPNATGDRVSVHASRNRLLRIQGVDSEAVNHGWLTDRDRFSFEAVASAGRLAEPLLRDGDELAPVSWSTALAAAAAALQEALGRSGPSSVGVLGGARLCCEDQYAWAKLAKGVIGTDNVDVQLGDGLPAELVCALPRATIADACRPGGVVLTLAGDLREEFGALFLRLRGAVGSGDVSLVEMAPLAGGLTPLARCSLRVRPGDADLIAEALLDPPGGAAFAGIATDELRAAGDLVGDRPLTVLVGRTSLAESAAPTAQAALRLARAFPEARFLPLLRRGAAAGGIDAGLAPGLLPGRTSLERAGAWYGSEWGAVPGGRGGDAAGILVAAAAGRIDVLVLLGADPLADFPDRELARRALERAGTVIAVDVFATASVAHADVALPAVTFGERSGTHVNIEGRATAVTRQITPPSGCRRDWEIAAELAHLLGGDLGIGSPPEAWAELTELSPLHAGADWDAVRAELDGVLLPVAGGDPNAAEGRARPPGIALDDVVLPPATAVPFDRYSYRLVADRLMYDRGTVTSNCPSLASLARPSKLRLNPRDFERLGCGADELLRVSSPAGTITVTAAGDDRVPPAVAALAVNAGDADPGELIDIDAAVCEIRVEAPIP